MPDPTDQNIQAAQEDGPLTDEARPTSEATGSSVELDRRSAFAIVASAVLLIAILYVIWLLLQQTVVVPDVVGQSQVRAKLELEHETHVLGQVTTTTAGDVEVGEVALQSPLPDTRVRRGSIVDVAISVGTGEKTELEKEREREALESPGYEFGQRKQYRPGARGAGALASDRTTPKSGGPFIPSVFGMTRTQAIAELQDAGYKVVVKSGPSTTGIPKGQVYAQIPAPQTEAERGVTVEIWVSTGPPVRGWPYAKPEQPTD